MDLCVFEVLYTSRLDILLSMECYYAQGSVAFYFTSNLVNIRKILFGPSLVCLCTPVTLETRLIDKNIFCKVNINLENIEYSKFVKIKIDNFILFQPI